VAFAGHDDHGVDADAAVVDLLGQGQEDVDGGVEGAHGEFGFHFAAVGADGGDLDVRGFFGDALHQGGQ